MKHLLFFFFLTFFGFLSFRASGISGESSGVDKVISALVLFNNRSVAIEDANIAMVINLPLSKPGSGTGNECTIVRAPDELIQASVLDFHDRYHAILEIFGSVKEFKSTYSSIPPPKQYSFLRILFRAIIAPNAP